MCSFTVTQDTLLCNGSKVTLNGKKVLLKNPYLFFMCKAVFYKQSYLSLQLFEKIALDQCLSSPFGDLHLCN